MPFTSHHIKGTYHQHGLSLWMLVLINWLSQYLPGFSTVKSPFFLSFHVSPLEGSHYVQPAQENLGAGSIHLIEDSFVFLTHQLVNPPSIIPHSLLKNIPENKFAKLFYFVSGDAHVKGYCFCALSSPYPKFQLYAPSGFCLLGPTGIPTSQNTVSHEKEISTKCICLHPKQIFLKAIASL